MCIRAKTRNSCSESPILSRISGGHRSILMHPHQCVVHIPFERMCIKGHFCTTPCTSCCTSTSHPICDFTSIAHPLCTLSAGYPRKTSTFTHLGPLSHL